jgi:hypothetical protein
VAQIVDYSTRLPSMSSGVPTNKKKILMASTIYSVRKMYFLQLKLVAQWRKINLTI